MTYNIMKTLYNDRGNKQYILMTDGLSEILNYDNAKGALKMTQLLNENSDARTEYELRAIPNTNSHEDHQKDAEDKDAEHNRAMLDIEIANLKKDANKNTPKNESDTSWMDKSGYYTTHGIRSDEDASIQRMIDLLNQGMDREVDSGMDEDPPC
jgi:hypothetical protein